MTAPSERDRDERVSLPLDPEVALRALLKVDPEAEPDDDVQGRSSESSSGSQPQR